jgi:hypothetical protein
MEEVDRLAEHLTGKVVVTADHGNHAGEMMAFGHPGGLRTPHLVKVPWHVIKDVPRETRAGSEGGGRLETERISDTIRQLKSDGKI